MTDQRGLIITTAGFTKDALSEAGASAKTPISLIDGKRLVELLAEKQIGVRRKAVYLLELNVGELLVGDEEPGPGEKSASLWPLPGGQQQFFETLLAFLDYVALANPTVDQMTQWVLTHYDKVTKVGVVKSYLRSVLYAMGLTDFDGERVVLTEGGKAMVRERDRHRLLALLRTNVLGIEEVLAYLTDEQSRKVGEVRAYLVKTLDLKWESDHQTNFRLQWLEACRAVERRDDGWRLVG